MQQYNKLFVITSALLLGNVATAGDYTFSTGVEYTIGKYGTSLDTTMLQVPFKLEYSTEQYALSVIVPYNQISGSEDVIFNGTTKSPMFSTTTISNVTHTDSGLGDITLSGTYQLQKEIKTRPWIAITGILKLGTADENKRLGTGENDYAVQLELAKKAIHGFIGYQLIGDTPTINYNDVTYGAVGITIPAGKNWTTVTEYYTEQASVSGVDNVKELSFSMSKTLKDKRRFGWYLIKGFTDSSPEWGAGVTLSYPL